MIEAVARHGYAGTTLSELVGLAGISKTTFYEHFDSKEACFWATFETIVSGATENVLAAYQGAGDPEGRLRAAIEVYGKAPVAAPKAAGLVLIESLCLGQKGARQRARSAEPIERVLREFYEEDSERGTVSEIEVKAVVAGLRHVVYRGLRMGRPAALAASTDELVRWILSYPQPDRGGGSRAKLHDGDGLEASVRNPTLGWDEPPDSPDSRRELSQRERILRAVAMVAGERGYAGLTVPAISATAGISNQTFYREFGGKQDAFIVAFETLTEQALRRVARVLHVEKDWPTAIEAGLAALLSLIASDPVFAHVAFFEAPAAGPPGLECADQMLDRFISFGEADRLPKGIRPPPAVVMQAVGGGLWAVITSELEAGRGAGLPSLAPELSAFALAPFDLR